MLQRMKALATQATSGSVSNNERGFIDQEYQALSTQIDSIADNTKFNGQALLNGSAGKTIGETGAGTGVADLAAAGVTVSLSGDAAAADWTLEYTAASGTFTLTDTTNSRAYTAQVDTSGVVIDGNVDFKAAGVNVNLKNFDDSADVASSAFTVAGSGTLSFQVGVTSSETIAVNISDVNVAALGISGTDTKTLTGAQGASDALDTAISNLNTARANTGSLMSRFEYASANLATQVENLDAARSTLMDVDVADEMTKFSASNVLQQAATAMLAQANQMPQGLLRLLQ
jgi:flagellin